MPEAFTNSDALGLYLSGAASDGGVQNDPASSLGGFRASKEIRGLGAIVRQGIPALVVKNVTAANGEGRCILQINGDGDLIYTPPNDNAGSPVSIAVGETKLIEGEDRCKAIRVFRSGDFPFSGFMEIDLVESFNGVFSMDDISNADRDSGEEYYRSFFVYGHGSGAKGRVIGLTIEQGTVGPRQSELEFAKEIPVGDSIQTIPDEKTAPIGVTFQKILSVGDVFPGDKIGIWIKKKFPASGAGKAKEKAAVDFQFSFVQ